MSVDEQPADMFLLMALALGLVALVFKVGCRRCAGGCAFAACCPARLPAPWRGEVADPTVSHMAQAAALTRVGLCGDAAQAKLPAWGSLVLCVLSLANGKAGQTDIKQYVTSFTFALFGLVSGYLVPARQRGAAGGGGGPSAL